jgi:hypothetical protein
LADFKIIVGMIGKMTIQGKRLPNLQGAGPSRAGGKFEIS